MMSLLKRFKRDESGVTAIEYAMIASIVCLGIIASVRLIPTALNGILTNASAPLVN